MIARNKKLRFLNLSSNNLVKPIKERIDRMGKAVKDAERPEMQAIIDIGRFIKRNKQLVHLNLENTGLSCDMIKELLVIVSKSRHIQAIHLCNNPGVYDPSLFYYAVELLDPINLNDWDDPGHLNKHKKLSTKTIQDGSQSHRQ